MSYVPSEDGVGEWEGRVERSPQTAPKALPEGTRFTFVSFSKNSSSWFVDDVQKHMPTGVWLEANGAHDLERRVRAVPGGYIKGGASQAKPSRIEQSQVVMLQHPWKHVMDLFLECKYDIWGLQVTRTLRKTAFPRGSLSVATDGLIEWLAHFLPDEQGQQSDEQFTYGCYNPRNFQTRYMITNAAPPGNEEERGPDLARAKQAVKRAAFVGISDFHFESLCLFHFHTTGTMLQECDCTKVGAPQAHHTAHHVRHHSIDDLAFGLLKEIDDLALGLLKDIDDLALGLLKEIDQLVDFRFSPSFLHIWTINCARAGLMKEEGVRGKV
eukprot:gene31214-6363_t